MFWTFFCVLHVLVFYSNSQVLENSDTRQPLVLNVREGQNIRISCSANATLYANVYWAKNDTNSGFRSNGTELIITNVSRNESGEYICFADILTSDDNATAIVKMTVNVLYGPQPKYDKMGHRYQVHAEIGSTAKLGMISDGNPYPNHTWRHNGVVLQNRYFIDYGIVSILSISDVQPRDYGDYSVQMTNAYGTYVAHYELIPSNLTEPMVQTLTEGESVQITCYTNQTTGVRIFWVKNDTNVHFRQDGRELHLTNVQRNTSGEYICYSQTQGSGAPAEELEVVIIDVVYASKISEFHVTPKTSVELQQVSAFCNFTAGTKNKNVRFYIMNNYTKHVYARSQAGDTSISYVKNVTCEDQGTWVCGGVNVEKDVTRSDNVTVFCRPRPKFNVMRWTYRTAIGDMAILSMFNYGSPAPNYTWSYNGRVLPASMHKDFISESILHIQNLLEMDYGNYTLVMENAYGRYEATYQLLPPGPPERPTNVRVTDRTPTSAMLHWVSGYNNGAQQHFVVLRWNGTVMVEVSTLIYDNSTNHGVGGQFKYLLKDLTPNTIYEFDVRAENNFGDSVTSDAPVWFWTKSPDTHKSSSAGKIVGLSALGISLLAAIITGIRFICVRAARKGSSGTTTVPLSDIIRTSKTDTSSSP